MSEIIDRRSQLILERLITADKPTTSEELATFANVTSRTIKSDIKKISKLLLDNGAVLQSKTGSGYQIAINDDELFGQFMYHLKFDSKEVKRIPQTKNERINYVIMKLLMTDYYMSINEISEEIFIENTTLISYFKDVNSILKRYHLELHTNNKQEVFIVGAEFHKRICISEFFFHNNISEDYHVEENVMFSSTSSKNEIRKIREILVKAIRNHEIQLSSYSIENLSIHILVALRRWLLFDYVKIDDNIADKIKDTVELETGKELVSELEKEFGIVLPYNEAVYFALHLKSKRINVKVAPFKNSEEEQKLQNTLNKIFDAINNRFGIRLHNDSTIKNYLLLHLRSMIDRIKIGFPIRNPQCYEQRREFLFATIMARIATEIIEKDYGVTVQENEEGFLVLYFNFALYRIEEKKPHNIAIINGDGRPEGIILLNKIAQGRAGFQDNISLIDIAQLEEDSMNYDVIISTTKLSHINKVPVIVCENSGTFNIEKLNRALNSFSFNFYECLDTFKQTNYFSSVKGNDIKEVKNQIISLLTNNNETELAYNINFDNPIDLGEGFALLLCKNEPKEMLIRFFALKKAMIINQTSVQFLVVMDSPKKDIPRFSGLCNILSKVLTNNKIINNYKLNPSYDMLIECIKQVVNYSD